MKMHVYLLGLTMIGPVSAPADQPHLATLQAQVQKGDPQAEFELGSSYMRGDGVPLDYAKAVDLYRKAAAQGNAKAMHNLGYLYSVGQGVPKDPSQSFDWYRQGAEHGAERSQEKLAYDYLNGTGVARDPALAAQWFEKAALQGSSDAQVQLGLLYFVGDTGLVQNYPAAAKWLKLAAGQGNTTAENALGVMNEQGLAMAKDGGQAVHLFTDAANKGQARAQFNLGRIYLEGSLVKRDRLNGYVWLKVATDQGDIPARNLLNDYLAGKGFTPLEIAEGDKAVAAFEAKAGKQATAASTTTAPR